MSFNDATSDWIWSYKTGSPIASDSATAPVTMHTNFGTTTFNLQQARGGSSANPFVAAAVAASSAPAMSSSTAKKSGGVPSYFSKVLIAHATLMAITFVLLFPLGAMAMRLLSFRGLVWAHAGWMIFAYCAAIAGLGMGIWVALTVKKLDTYHAIIGIVVVGCLVIQPFTGLIHHLLFKRKGRRNAATYPHVWWGRAIITLAIINGGFGLQLARAYPPLSNSSRKGEIAYGAVAGPVWLTWMGVIAYSHFKRSGKQNGETGEKAMGDSLRTASTADGSVKGPEVVQV